jgi:hypothetical protein
LCLVIKSVRAATGALRAAAREVPGLADFALGDLKTLLETGAALEAGA